MSIKMNKLWLEEGYCPKDGYQCLMPVEYQAVEVGGVVKEYRKVQIACHHLQDQGCEYKGECPFFQTAPEILEKNAHWFER